MSSPEALNSILRSSQFFRSVNSPEAEAMKKLVAKAWKDASQEDRDAADPSLVAGLVGTFLDPTTGLASSTYEAIREAGVTPSTMVGRRVVGGVFRILSIDNRRKTVQLEEIESSRVMASEQELPRRRPRSTKPVPKPEPEVATAVA